MDRFAVLDTCGTGNLLPRYPRSGFVDDVLASGGSVTWGSVEVTAAGGEYSSFHYKKYVS